MTVNIGDRGEHVPRQLSLHTNREQFVVGLVDVPVNLADIISIEILRRESGLKCFHCMSACSQPTNPPQPFPRIAIAPNFGWPVIGSMMAGFGTKGLKKASRLAWSSFLKGNAKSQRSPQFSVKCGVSFMLS